MYAQCYLSSAMLYAVYCKPLTCVIFYTVLSIAHFQTPAWRISLQTLENMAFSPFLSLEDLRLDLNLSKSLSHQINCMSPVILFSTIHLVLHVFVHLLVHNNMWTQLDKSYDFLSVLC